MLPPPFYSDSQRTPVPTVKERVFIFSHTKKRCGARRGGIAALTAQWAVNSQSGEQFIIATGGFSRNTVASVPATFLLLFSSPEKRRYLTQPRTSVPTVLNTFVSSHTNNFLKSLLCYAREVASSNSEKTVGSFGGRTQFAPTMSQLFYTTP